MAAGGTSRLLLVLMVVAVVCDLVRSAGPALPEHQQPHASALRPGGAALLQEEEKGVLSTLYVVNVPEDFTPMHVQNLLSPYGQIDLEAIRFCSGSIRSPTAPRVRVAQVPFSDIQTCEQAARGTNGQQAGHNIVSALAVGTSTSLRDKYSLERAQRLFAPTSTACGRKTSDSGSGSGSGGDGGGSMDASITMFSDNASNEAKIAWTKAPTLKDLQ